MSDSISIPDQFEFKEMLSHTFPGFFSAFSIFMLIDYLSPVNFTVLAIGSLTGLISFVGFIIIIGTILGVIIDGVHHTFIEDDIFDNFEAIYKLKLPIKKQLEAACPSYHDNFSRHFFMAKIGDKGAKAKEFEDLFDQAYYRYSEFYSNIFISLVIFSIIAPFYFFDVLELSWTVSEGIGIASLLIACLCLKCSYTSYATYLMAQSSAICGFIKDAKNLCDIECKNDANNDLNKKFYIVRYFIASIFLIFLIIPFRSFIPAIPFNSWYLLISIVPIIILDYFFVGRFIINPKRDDTPTYDDQLRKFNLVSNFLGNLARNYYCDNQNWEKDKNKQINNIAELKKYVEDNKDKLIKKTQRPSLTEIALSLLPSISTCTTSLDLKRILSKSSSAALISFISGLLLCMVVLAIYYTPINLNIDPLQINFSENITDVGSIKNPVVTLSLKNLGAELDKANLTSNGIEANWLEFTDIDDKGAINKTSSNKITIKDIAKDKTRFVRIRLNSAIIDLGNASPGSYAGSIDIDYSTKSQSIPVRIDLTKKNPTVSKSASK